MRKLYALLAGILLSIAAIHANPVSPDVANFTITVDQSSSNAVFTNTSVIGNEPGVRKAFWSFGDGGNIVTGPLQGTQHHYASAGTYNVCLRIYRYRPNQNDSVLSAQVCKTLTIESICAAAFERIPAAAANPLLAYFKALPFHNANKRPTRICWQFGDGRDTCIQYSNTNPGPYTVGHLYASPGSYEVCVKILYDGGCEARKCDLVRIESPDSCAADFIRLPATTINNPLSILFKALPWHNNNKKPHQVCWTFGDGRDTCINYLNSYTGLYVVPHTYQHTGNYQVCVKIIYDGGCEARKCDHIQVGPPDTCNADFERIPVSANTSPLLNYFRALPQHNNNRKPARICWQFGDGRDTCINYEETFTGQYVVSHRYNNAGPYEVCVKILYYGGCEARKCRPVLVGEPDSCSANFESPAASPTALGKYFIAQPWHNHNKKPVRVCWIFGDGQDTCIQYPVNYTGQYGVYHLYTQPGTYNVCVRIRYDGGCESEKCKPIVVPPIPQTCSVHLFEIAPSVTGLVRGFLAIPVAIPSKRPVRICWTFGDGADTCIMIDPQQPLSDLFITHTYPAPGVYHVCVKVLFEGGCSAQDCHEIVIRSASNICGGYMTDSMMAPRTYKFKGYSINAPDDEVISYRWTFGDGTGQTGREVTHIYSQPGNFEVCLTIRTILGCETRICKTIRVPGNNQITLNLSPNPVITVLHVEFLSAHTEQVNIKILNSMGTIVRSYVHNVTVGPNSWNIDLSTLMPGVYSFVVQSPNQIASAIFIKQ